MIVRLPARATRAAMGLFVAALASTTPVHADEKWLRQAFERPEQTRSKQATTTQPRARRGAPKQASQARVQSDARQQRQPQATEQRSFLADLSGVPILGSLLSLVGLHEHRDRAALRAKLGVDPARTPWCGYFMGHVVQQMGRTPPSGHGLAASWKSYGSAVTLASAQAGDVVVTRNRHGYHVAAFHSSTPGRVCVLGGNQSNRVSVACVSARSVVAVRR